MLIIPVNAHWKKAGMSTHHNPISAFVKNVNETKVRPALLDFGALEAAQGVLNHGR